MADYKEVRGSTLAAQIPGFPSMFVGMTFGGGNNGTPEYGGDLVWAGPPRPGAYAAVIEKELDVPVEVVLAWGSSNNPKRMVSTLHRLVNLTAEIVGNLLDASNSHS